MSVPSTLRRVAQRLLPLLDLTGLDPETDETAVRRLCARARTPAGTVAAVCIAPCFVALAKDALKGSAVPVAAFCLADTDLAGLAAAGADEVDLAFPSDVLTAAD